jgi:G3E family GTPase
VRSGESLRRRAEHRPAIPALLPGTVYRAKGVIHSTDAPKQRAVLQVVGRRVDIALQDEWGDRTPRTQIVVIGAANSLDPEKLRQQFDMTVAPRIPATSRI